MKNKKCVFIIQTLLVSILLLCNYFQRAGYFAVMGLSVVNIWSVISPYIKWILILIVFNIIFFKMYCKAIKKSVRITMGIVFCGITIGFIAPALWVSSICAPVKYISTDINDYPLIFASLPATWNGNSILPTGIPGTAYENSSVDFESSMNFKGDHNSFDGYLVLNVKYQGEGGKTEYKTKKKTFFSYYSEHQNNDYSNTSIAFVFNETSHIKNTTVVLFSDDQNTIKYVYTFGGQYEILKLADGSVSIRETSQKKEQSLNGSVIDPDKH